jgi:hypothetical protein
MYSLCILLGLAVILHGRLIQTQFLKSGNQRLISSFLNEHRISFAVFVGCGKAGKGQIKVNLGMRIVNVLCHTSERELHPICIY